MRENIGGANSKSVQCPNCGSTKVETHRAEDSFMYGTGATAVEMSAIIPFRECHECGFEFTDAEAEDARQDAICRYLGVMTPSEVAAIRRQYDMTRTVFAAKTRIGEASLARWETGQLIQNAANDDYLYLLSFPQNMRRLEWRRSCKQLPSESILTVQVVKFRQLTERIATPQQRSFLRPKGVGACT